MDFKELGDSLTDAYNSIYEGKKSKEDHPSAKPNPKLNSSGQVIALHKAIAPGRIQKIERLMKRQPKLSRKQAEDMVDKERNESAESWLGNNGFNREAMISLNDAYESMYNQGEEINEEVEVIEDEYSVSPENAQALEEGKKKCKEGYKYDKDKKKCVKKKKSSSKSNKTVVVVKNKGGGYWGGGYHGHGHGGSNGGGDGESETNGGGDGGGDGGGGE